MLRSQLVHLATLFDQFSSQLVLNDGILENLLPEFVKDFTEVTSAKIEELSQLVLACLGAGLVVLGQNLLLEEFNLRFILDLLLLVPFFKAHDLLLLKLYLRFLICHFFGLLLQPLL